MIDLSIGKKNATFTKSILSFSLSLRKTSLSLRSRSLGLRKRNTSAERLGLKITESINSQAVGISTSGLSKVVLDTRPNLLKKSLTLRNISFSKGLSEFCVDFIELHTESLRQSVGFRCGLRKLEQRILISLTLSFSKSFNTLSILQSNISVSITHLTIQHSTLKERRYTGLENRHGIHLIRTGAGNISTLSGLSRTGVDMSRLDSRTLDERIDTSGTLGSTLSGRRVKFVISPFSHIFLTLRLSLCISTTISNLLLIHLFLPFTILTIQLTLSDCASTSGGSSSGACDNCGSN